ncbi:energy-coupling factor ABC transporter permease [Thermosynechococcus sp. HN-54]|uniref:energy-coupling factor ABC transporter permease n=1 Tax=Thermosynechococcus sp. HN-54 TaxID=2933959 RepID=UPI00202D04E1|nr:energy-coupling factor ABC transporter permease [Thermosynechococcus sp. HN-54]URR35968.1 energy-coupling factor ABC transporter permease [Thermosynechococcus sp. HN-54]
MSKSSPARQYGSLGAIALLTTYLVVASPNSALAMHISEGFLPLGWAVGWWLAFLPFLAWGLWALRQQIKYQPASTLLIALAGAYAFVLSSLKIPSVTGSSSHPMGIALGAVLFRPPLMAVLGTLVLLFQALLLAHGGLTTLGANAFSMAVVGSWLAWLTYGGLSRVTTKLGIALFSAAFVSNLATYSVTALQLALAFPDPMGGVATAFAKFAALFAVTQIPLAISEGLLTVLVWNWLTTYCTAELQTLKLLSAGKGDE